MVVLWGWVFLMSEAPLYIASRLVRCGEVPGEMQSTLEATQGEMDGFFSQLPYKCHQNRVASVGD